MSENIIHRENLIQDFIDSTTDALTTMSAVDVKTKSVEEINGQTNSMDVTACLDITGILGFSGGRKGAILVTFPTEIALKVVGGMLGVELTEIDADVRDGIGEVVNMIAGGAKTRLQSKGINFELSIPNTVIGRNHQIAAPATTTRTRIEFETDIGDFFMEVYIKKG